MKKVIITFAILFLLIISANSQVRVAEGLDIAPKIYLDCDYCNMDFIKKSIPLVNFVREHTEANIFIQVFRQNTGSNGSEYTIDFTGKGQFSGLNDTIRFNVDITMTENDRREKILEVLKLGLVRYLIKTPLAKKIQISFPEEKTKTEEIKDVWDNWVFSLSTNGWFSGEKSSKGLNSWSNLSAGRTTADYKGNISLSASYSENSYDYENIKYYSISRSQSFSAFLVKSMGEHWSAGAWLYLNSSTYNNIALSGSIAPAVEYNIFPYSESVRKQLRFEYKIVPKYQKYNEETIYLKTKEFLTGQELEISFEYILPWGSFSSSVTGSSYFHDFRKNHLDIYTYLSVKLFKGLSANYSMNYSSVHNQLSLPRASATLEEVLLARRQLETQYNYWGSFGLSYTFGSIYQNVVNPRFGD